MEGITIIIIMIVISIVSAGKGTGYSFGSAGEETRETKRSWSRYIRDTADVGVGSSRNDISDEIAFLKRDKHFVSFLFS